MTLDDIRLGGPSAVAQRLLSTPSDPNRVIIVNAVAESDMHVFVCRAPGSREEWEEGIYTELEQLLFRPASELQVFLPITLEDLGINTAASSSYHGGLIVAGSYVPKTTAQLKVLRERRGDKLAVFELDVAELVTSPEEAEAIVGTAAAEASRLISAGRDVLVMTSRALIKGHDGASSLHIGSKVAHALVRLVEGIKVRPRLTFIAKGGITSSDAATKGLKMRRAEGSGPSRARCAALEV